MDSKGPIGVFDSGYGGLTVFRSIIKILPQYDYIYLGDNARSPYGNRSFDTIHQYTRQSVEWFFGHGCPLVILACNTASAKALRTIQQRDLPTYDKPGNRVLGVIRPTAEVIGNFSRTGVIGVLGTKGTIQSASYEIEIQKFFPQLKVHSLACPMWVPLIENGEHLSGGADYFVQKYIDELLSSAPGIDTILLACTHYPLLIKKIEQFLPAHIKVVAQGDIVADSLKNYLVRHPEMDERLAQSAEVNFYTTDDTVDFDRHATSFFGRDIASSFVHF